MNKQEAIETLEFMLEDATVSEGEALQLALTALRNQRDPPTLEQWEYLG